MRTTKRPRRAACKRGIVLTLVAALGLTAAASALGSANEALKTRVSLLENYDARSGQVRPKPAQLRAASNLDAIVHWNRFGTPSSVLAPGGYLAKGVRASTPAKAALAWIAASRKLFGLSSTEGLRVRHVSRLAGTKNAYAVLLGQRFGGLQATQDGLATVGVVGSPRAGWKVYYASSALSGADRLSGAVRLSTRAAWVKAAAGVRPLVSLGHVKSSRKRGSWTTLRVAGSDQPQLSRLVAFPTPHNGVVPAYETYVVDGLSSGFKQYVDARTGRILLREDISFEGAAVTTTPFSGTLPATDGGCGPQHPFAVPANTVSLDVAATADLPANDIVLRLYFGTTLVQAADTATSPEVIHYEPAGGVTPGSYAVQVCEFEDGAAPTPPLTYTGTFIVNDAASATPLPYPPRWKVFPANPLLGTLAQDPWNLPSTDSRKVWCWDSNVNGAAIPGCDAEVGNLASRVPWDHDLTTDLPTFTTRGNNAITSESWTNPLAPGPFAFQPTSTQRSYSYPWTNAWYTSDCAPTNTLTPGVSNDISAAVTNLFAMHNRMHDWSYFLGFTEENWNAQQVNFGLTAKTRQNDAVLGQAQAGALGGAFPGYMGRDNANMRPLPEGVPPITNMYLWQPLAGAFYAPCADGDYDMAVIGHEYAHLIENRMIGKGGTRTGHHAGAMGESNGDLNAVEYLNEYGFVPVSGENPFSVGAYATGNKQRAIRNYGMNYASAGAFPTPGVSPQINPLNFGDLGYDLTGGQVHADGEIWSAVNYDLRQALVSKFNGQYPASNAALQRKCADGLDTADHCPGNRRWAQLMYDAYLLMPVGPSMLDARDAYLAADQARFGGANQTQIWNAFARRGFGQLAFSTNGLSDENEIDPRPDFESPLHNEATVRFRAIAPDEGNAVVTNAKVYVGHYEARVSPIADTDPASNAPATSPASTNNLDDTARFVAGTYEFVANAAGYGHVRFRLTLAAGSSQTVTISMPTNRASAAKGATAAGDGAEHGALIDDDEGTNWDDPALGAAINTVNPQVTVDLAGGVHRINRVQVSAFLLAQNRFTALRQFRIDVSTNGITFAPVYTSPANAFPGATPRPVAPELILRSFSFPAVNASHVRIVALHNQCTGNTAFQGEVDADPTNNTDCRVGTPGAGPVELPADPPQLLPRRDDEVHIAELQVFGREGGTGPPPNPNDPVVVMTNTGPATAPPGGNLTYTLNYTNLGPAASQNAKIVDTLPAGTQYVTSSGGGAYGSGKVTWNLGTVNAGASGSRTVTVSVPATTTLGTVLLNQAEFTGDLTSSPPTAATTLVLP